MKNRLRALIRKEFIQTLRDVPIVILVIYTFAEISLCGWALTMDVKNVPTAIPIQTSIMLRRSTSSTIVLKSVSDPGVFEQDPILPASF